MVSLTTTQAPLRYASRALVLVLYLVIPLVGLAGRCAVVPTGTVKAPVALIVATPESGCKTIFPVVSAVLTSAVVVVVPARIVLILAP
jgi:hypothetical protein